MKKEKRFVNILLKADRIITDRDYFSTKQEADEVVYDLPLVFLKTTEVVIPDGYTV